MNGDSLTEIILHHWGRASFDAVKEPLSKQLNQGKTCIEAPEEEENAVDKQ